MNSKYLFISVLCLVFAYSAKADDLLLFQPLTANNFEPRIGAFYQFGTEKIRLDIGYSLDFLNFKKDNNNFSVGADFFTYTRLRTAGNFKFPVETSDYYFGVNGAYKVPVNSDVDCEARLRVAHISSHLVDGMSSDGVFRRMPFVYSREFVDLTAALRYRYVRAYVGLNTIFHKIPDEFNTCVPSIGMDFDVPFSQGSRFSVSGGYDFKLEGISDIYNGINSAELGIKIKTKNNIGFLIGLHGYAGKSMHGMYFNEYDHYIGLGFRLVY